MLLCVVGGKAQTCYVSDATGNDDNTGAGWDTALKTISNGIAKASAGYTVLVSNGTYNLTTNISINKASLILRSLNGRGVTIINGNYPNTTSRCINISAAGVTIDGFSITNGFAHSNVYGISTASGGGGIYCYNDYYPTICNCIIAGNSAHQNSGYVAAGGGILFIERGTISNCIISGNTAIGAGGGGVYVRKDNSILRNCIISNNIVSGSGNGGGMQLSGSNTIVENCVVVGNSVDTSSGRGGGTYANVGPKIRNCLFINNLAYIGGGLLVDKLGNNGGYVDGCTIMSNRATDGGGIYFLYTNSLVRNSIIQSNSPGNLTTYDYNSNQLYYCCAPSTNNFDNLGVITNNPVFLNFPAQNFRMARNSQCINAGTNQSWMTNSVDLDGRIRIRYGTVDMGCYEYISPGMIFSAH